MSYMTTYCGSEPEHGLSEQQRAVTEEVNGRK
jgi:hypothetical protein